MRSRADARRFSEHALRAALLIALVAAFWRSTVSFRANDTVRATSTDLQPALKRALTRHDAPAMEIAITGTPSRMERDALVALRGAGMAVRWTGSVAPLALEVIRDRDPGDGAELRVTGGTDAMPVSDSAGTLDTLRRGNSTMTVGTLVGVVRARDGHTTAASTVPSTSPRRAVLVLGRADWESKFVMSALGEAGWQVRARIPAAPGVDISDDALLPLDTARYDAVIALDTTALDLAPAIVRFVSEGGGLVLSGAATALQPLGVIAPAMGAARLPGRILLTEDTVTRRDLPITPLQSVRSDAIALERQPGGLALAARRAGVGRVLALGYDESWRWRMLGGESGLAAHRDWWSRAVASVSPERADTIAAGIDAVPRVALVNALGPASSVTSERITPQGAPLPLWMLLLAIVAVLAEIASRRLRGER